jgi:hypothetical protein
MYRSFSLSPEGAKEVMVRNLNTCTSGGRHLGFFAGVMLAVFGRRRKVTGTDLSKMEFRHSTQRMGLSFSEKLRNAFRPRWLRKG